MPLHADHLKQTMQDPYTRSTTADNEAAIMMPMHKTMNTIKVEKDQDNVVNQNDEDMNRKESSDDYMSGNNKDFEIFAKEQDSNMEINLKRNLWNKEMKA